MLESHVFKPYKTFKIEAVFPFMLVVVCISVYMYIYTIWL